MILTSHAKTRVRQRGFNKYVIDFISNYGRVENAPGGAIKYFLGRKEAQMIHQELKGLIQIVNRATGKGLIVKDDFVITAYNQR